jgi:uncharacterized protein (UPF0548 family)
MTKAITVRGMFVLFLRKPTTETIQGFLAAQGKHELTYTAVGATAQTPPSGYVVDHTRIKLGEGETVFRSAVAALQRWDHFRLGWVEAWSPDSQIKTSNVVAVMGWAFGFWWLNACRIVYVVDETGPITKFGFAYGTLPGHVESGEERFLIEWDQGNDGVWYDILAFSRPNHFLSHLGYPVVRRLQKRFGRDSAATMLRSVRTAN